MYGQHYEFIDQMLKTESVMDMYDMHQACLSGAVALDESGYGDTTEGQHIEEIIVIQDTDKLQRSLEDLLLGEIDVTYKKVRELTSSPVLISKTDTRIGWEQPGIVDLTVLDVDGTQISVVADFRNKCVKSFFTTKNRASHSKLSLESNPWGITKLKERQVLVAVPNSNKIVTIEVSPKLRLNASVNTGKTYHGLAVLNNTSIVAGSCYPDSCVDILNMAGQVMTSIKDPKLFTAPWGICVTSKGNILVSDNGKKTVTCLTSEGNVVWTYISDGSPRGITALNTGSVLFADSGSKKVILLTETGKFSQNVLLAAREYDVSSMIFQLTEIGNFGRNLLTSENGLKNPQCVYYDGKRSLFVSNENHLYEFSIEK